MPPYMGLGRHTCGHSDAGVESVGDVVPRDELGARDAVYVGDREANKVEVGCCRILGRVFVLLV